MPYSCFAKEVQEYARACEHLIGEWARGSSRVTEQELELVHYYTDEVVKTITGKSSSFDLHHASK